MNPDPYRDLVAAYQHLTRRPPAWTAHPDLAYLDGIGAIVNAVRDDQPDPARADHTVRTLVAIGRSDPTAITVVLHALTAELTARLARTVTGEYRADALGELAAVILESDLTGPRIGHRLVNRAHNRTHKQHHRVRHHGHLDPKTVDPYAPDRIIDLHDYNAVTADVAELAAARVDLQRFHTAVVAAVASGELTGAAWATFSDHRLRSVFVAADAPAATRRRVAAYRAAKCIQPFIDVHLKGHAA
jgi:hypothetical protein